MRYFIKQMQLYFFITLNICKYGDGVALAMAQSAVRSFAPADVVVADIAAFGDRPASPWEMISNRNCE
jgi:hypothetical protein